MTHAPAMPGRRPKTGPSVPRRLEQLRRRLSGLSEDTTDAPVSQRVAAHFGSMFSIVTSLTLTIVLVLVIFVAIRDFQDDSIYLETISIAPSLVEQGITPVVVGARIVERIAFIKSETLSLAAENPTIAVEATRHELVLIGGVVSLPRLVSALKKALGRPDRRVIVDVTTSGGTVRVGATYLLNGVHDGAFATRNLVLLDGIAEVGAALVLKVCNPEFLTEYYYGLDSGRSSGPQQWQLTLALLDFRELRGKEPRSAEVSNWRAIIDFHNGNFSAALPVHESLAKAGWRPVISHIRAASSAVALHDEQRALDHLNAARKAPSHSANELALIGATYRYLGKASERLETSLQAFKRWPESTLARITLAEALSEGHREGEAIKLLDAVPIPSFKDDMLNHLVILTYVLMRMENFPRIAELRRQYERFAPTDRRMRWLVAEDAVGQRDYVLAEAIWTELDGHDNTWDEPAIRRADILALRNLHIAAIVQYDVCLGRFPHESRCIHGKARSLVETKDLVAADRTYAQLADQDRDNVVALREWASLKRTLGRSEGETRALSMAAEAQRRLSIPIVTAGR